MSLLLSYLHLRFILFALRRNQTERVPHTATSRPNRPTQGVRPNRPTQVVSPQHSTFLPVPPPDSVGIPSLVPRRLSVEYPGAIYHVMNRGDRRVPIFRDDPDRVR